MTSYVGERDGLRFLSERGRITTVGAPSCGRPDLRFADELIDLAVPPRKSSSLVGRVSFAEQSGQMTAGGRDFPVASETVFIGSTSGFGRSLRCTSIARDTAGHMAVLLCVELPSHARYEVRWDTTSGVNGTFALSADLDVTVLTELAWTFDSGLFAVETGDAQSEVAFLVESHPPASPVQDVVLVVARGHEREALSVRAALGCGFVPCFVTPGEWVPSAKDAMARIVVGPGGVTGPDADVMALRELGRPIPDRTITVGDDAQACGPGLYLAIRHGARLRWGSGSGARASLTDVDGSVVREWDCAGLVGQPLSPLEAEVAAKPGRELVVCENVLDDLLVCQSVGYASAFGCGIAFLPAIDPPGTDAWPDGPRGFELLADLATRAVPKELRSPSVEALTVFTRGVPLHLTSADGDERWLNRYSLAHLPGRTASLLVPRVVARSTARPPKISFSVVFDTLDASTDTEGGDFAGRGAEVLHHPLLFQGAHATKAVLKESLERLSNDLIVLITHGRDDFIEDVDNAEIEASAIGTWTLRGEPLVLNNSCSSWTSTGEAFLAAGARGVIGTLWPVDNGAARRIGARIAERIHTGGPVDPADLLHSAVDAELRTSPVTAAAYVYVGVPATVSFSAVPINSAEVASHFSAAAEALIVVTDDVVRSAGTEVVRAFRYVMNSTLRQRASAALVSGEMPLHLEGGFAQYSLLDVDFLLARVGLDQSLMLWNRVPEEGLPALTREIEGYLAWAMNELGTWDDRHDAHLRRKREDITLPPALAGLEIGALGEMGYLNLAAKMALAQVLRFSALLAARPGPAERDRARSLFGLAALMVTTPADLEPDRSVRDEMLIARIVEGIKQRTRVLTDFTGTGTGRVGSFDEVDLLALAVPKAELANRFGVVLLKLGEPQRALGFFRAALQLAEPDSVIEANIRSNLAQVDAADDSPWAPFETQAASGDAVNASITAANILLRAASDGRTVPEPMVQRARVVIETIDPVGLRALHLGDFLSATAQCLASANRHADAADTRSEVRGLLSQAGPPAASHLSRLSRWYAENEHFARAARTCLADGVALEKLGWNEVAGFAYARGAYAAVADGNGRSAHSWDPRVMTECSRRLGRLLSLYPEMRSVLGEKTADILEGTTAMRDAFARGRLLKQSLAAYQAERAWPGTTSEPGWDLLSDACHPRNADDFRALTGAGRIRRAYQVTFDAQVRARIDMTTTWTEPAAQGSAGVLTYLPLLDAAATSVDGPHALASAWAAFELYPGQSVTVSQEDAAVLRRRNDQMLSFVRRCGSRIVPHTVAILLPPSWVPVRVGCRQVAGSPVASTVTWVGTRFRLDFGSSLDARAWLADVHVTAVSAPAQVFATLAVRAAADHPTGMSVAAFLSLVREFADKLE